MGDSYNSTAGSTSDALWGRLPAMLTTLLSDCLFITNAEYEERLGPVADESGQTCDFYAGVQDFAVGAPDTGPGSSWCSGF